MANRYANLVGANKIKDEYTKINAGFDAVQVDVDKRKLLTFTSLADIGLSSSAFDSLTTEEQFIETIYGSLTDGSVLILGIIGNNTPIVNVSRFLPQGNGILTVMRMGDQRTIAELNASTSTALGGAVGRKWIGSFVPANTPPNARWSGWDPVWVNGNNRATLGLPGIQRLSSGLIVQWAYVSSVAHGDPIVFPVAFPNGCVNVVVTMHSTSPPSVGITGMSATGFNIQLGDGSSGRAFYYRAIGF